MSRRDVLGIGLMLAVVAVLLVIVAGEVDDQDGPTVPTVPPTGLQVGIRAPERMSSTGSASSPPVPPTGTTTSAPSK